LKEEFVMTGKYNSIEYENVSGVAKINLNKPPLNVLDIAMMKEIVLATEEAQKDPSVKLLVIAGKGKAFSGGVDVADHTADKVDAMTEIFHKMCMSIIKFPQPTVAVVNGHALGGGCELAIACDMVVASEAARIGQPEIKLGVFPPIAALVMPNIIGRKKALELILTGEVISAAEAYRIGLVNYVVPPEKLEETAKGLIDKLGALSGIVMKYTKQAGSAGLEGDTDSALKKIEDIYLHKLMKTHDAEEGLKSFMEKRAAVWNNK
jgi:cyclohexa-1,5-dienecarbonyl-CoA hydratase